MLQIPLGPLSSADELPLSTTTFLAGPENRQLEVVFRSVLGSGHDSYNPIVLTGPSGCGKTHLARGLAEAWKTCFRRGSLWTTAADFARAVTEAQETHALEEFRQRHRVPLLVIEDLGHLEGKPGAQEELVLTLDAQVESGHRVLLTAPRAPTEMTELTPGLRSRLTAGLVVPIALPQLAARMAIVAALAAERGIELSPRTVRLLAESLEGPVSELSGVLMELQARAELSQSAIDYEFSRQYLTLRKVNGAPRLREIAAASARHFGLKVAELRGSTRRQAVVRARGVAIFLARRLTANSLQEIGRYFGGRDHTTIIHAFRTTEEAIRDDQVVQEAVAAIQRRLGKT